MAIRARAGVEVFAVPAEVAVPRLVRAPAAVVALVPPLAIGSVPVTPVVNGSPVTLVSVPEAGVPSAGVVSVGLVSVLLVSVSAPAKVERVPVSGRVMLVVAVVVRVVAWAPEVVKLPPNVMVLPLLSTPVPPYWPVITVPFHVPVVIVPRVVMLD